MVHCPISNPFPSLPSCVGDPFPFPAAVEEFESNVPRSRWRVVEGVCSRRIEPSIAEDNRSLSKTSA